MRTLLPMTLIGCLGGPAGEAWAPATPTDGPRVVYDASAKPLPEIPLPNDAATRLDPGSPTGRWLNVSLDATTHHERVVRERFNGLDGFGAFAPLAVAFDAPLDLEDLWARHNGNDDFRDDAILVLNVDPDCARFGEEVRVGLGDGRYVATLYGHGRWREDALAPDGYRWDTWGNTLFPFDGHFDSNNWIFEENDEDLDGDGVLDPEEDLDHDGVLDVPNLWDPTACRDLRRDTRAYDTCIADNLLTFYERETNTLVMRPRWPMEERCTHAVILTNRLRGEDGEPVQSPFPGVNHRDQTEALKPATDLLSRYGLSLSDVAFAWTFTVGTQTKDMQALRQGLYGVGPFSQFAEEFPPTWDLWTRDELRAPFGLDPHPTKGDDTFLPGACTSDAMTSLWDQGLGEWNANMCAIEADLSTTSLWFGGTFEAPNLLVDKDGIATEAYPADHDESFELDLVKGEVTYGRTEIPFFCVLPYEDPGAECEEGNPEGVPFCKPFPTVLYAHGYGSSRSEVTLHMGRHTAMGQAACALDSYGHGLNRWIVDPEASATLRLALPRFEETGVPELAAMLSLGRDRDLNNDGLPDGGMDQWTANIFHTRDMVRQSAFEAMQLVRILRSMDGERRSADGRKLGDVDGDGTVDLGGPRNVIGQWGISLGGIISGVLAGAEPGLDAVSPNAGGAGLTNISTRSTQAGVPEAVVMPMMSQLVAACLPDDGHDNPLEVDTPGGSDCWRGRGAEGATWKGGDLRIALFGQDEARLRIHEAGTIPGVQPGDVLVVENLANGEIDRARIHTRGWARATVPADALDAIERRHELGWGDGPGPFDLDRPERVADPLRITVERGDTVIGELTTWQHTSVFQGSRFLPGTKIVALQDGYGYRRNSPDIRRLLGFAQHAISPGDPGTWAQHIWIDPIDASYDPNDDGRAPRALVMPTAGDSTVPASTGLDHARAAGMFGDWRRDPSRPPESGWRELYQPDPRYGEPIDQWLVDTWVVEGDDRFERWAGFGEPADWNPRVLFDPDDPSDGTSRFSCGGSDWSALIGENECPDAYRTPEGVTPENFFDVPDPGPGGALRIDRDRGDGLYDGFRVPLLRPAGQHGIYNAQSFRPFDNDAYMVNMTARFLGTAGRDLSHEPGCDCSAAGIANFTLDGTPRYPGQQVACSTDPADAPATLKVCDATCARGWGLRIQDEAACVTEE